MAERRRQARLTESEGYLQQMPALELLNRLPTAILGVGSLGGIAYANPTFVEMLGYPDRTTVTGLQLPQLLTGHEELAPADCLDTLRTTASAVEWNHSQGYVVQTMVSPPLPVRDTDSLLWIGVTDITAWLWETNRRADAQRAGGQTVS